MSAGKKRLDVALAERGLVASRSQAESYIKLGKVKVNGKILNPSTSLGAGKTGYMVGEQDTLEVMQEEQYVSRAALKLASVSDKLKLDFKGKIVLDVGSSTGGFTDYALRSGAAKVIAVDVGTDQLHPSLRANERLELHEKTDIRSLRLRENRESRMENEEIPNSQYPILSSVPDIVLIDVSFISLRQILPAVAKLSDKNTQIAAMLKPQFEAQAKAVNKGVIKNDSVRRRILKDFEAGTKNYFVITAKADSEVAGAKGNMERFYLLHKRSVDF